MGKCYFKRGKITCPREAVKVIAVKVGNRVKIRWELCTEHTVTATHEAMEYTQQFGGALHTTKIDGPKVKAAVPEEHVHPYLRMPRELYDRSILARMRVRQAQNTFFIAAIEAAVTEIEKGEGNADRES